MTNAAFERLFDGPPRRSESKLTDREMDIAASIQVVTERAMLNMARYAHHETGCDNLCLAGGVALNCVGNGKILREGPFKSLWIQPAAGDAGGALGAALFVHHRSWARRDPWTGGDSQRGLLEPSFSNEEIGAFIAERGIKAHRFDDVDSLTDRVADVMQQEAVVGWLQGRMEFGPRALGARSIIGDARSRQMQTTMNVRSVHESFVRSPFGPLRTRLGGST
jgi:carbamoyltransferase